ncbi:unnamed protein product [Phytophthora fragariaefolia]|uniref:Unnamed protein product n=1 Tax=Phytophthora fragariaefolia TaxID=1490495 RepID=A0A9W6WLR1_9STRA|nr:unnamed protein product [Phytophthora fragariaefolia]
MEAIRNQLAQFSLGEVQKGGHKAIPNKLTAVPDLVDTTNAVEGGCVNDSWFGGCHDLTTAMQDSLDVEAPTSQNSASQDGQKLQQLHGLTG